MKRRIALFASALLACFVILLAWALNDRPDFAGSGIVPAPVLAATDGGSRMTWFGVTTLLFDDGATQILIDGFYSRPSLIDIIADVAVTPDAEAIDAALAASGIDRLAAVIPVHSHFDHAMDSAEVARRTGAVLLGSASTAALGRGAGLAADQIDEVEGRTTRRYGRFTVTLVPSRHMPIDSDGNPPLPGTIDAPLVPPAPISAWREGGSWSIVVAHPDGTTLVQGSAGFVPGALADVRVDAVALGIGGLGRLGEAYTAEYWKEIVLATGASRIHPVHWDDFTRRYGDIRTLPRIGGDDPTESLGWMMARAKGARGDGGDVAFELLEFGRATPLRR